LTSTETPSPLRASQSNDHRASPRANGKTGGWRRDRQPKMRPGWPLRLNGWSRSTSGSGATSPRIGLSAREIPFQGQLFGLLSRYQRLTLEGSLMEGLHPKTKEPTRKEYLLKRIAIDKNGCWIWRGRPEKYGTAEWNRVSVAAHHASYEEFIGPIPVGKILRHTCDIRGCINWEHLVPGTKKDNRRDFMERHPRARMLCLEASKAGAKGVKRFWDSMTPEARAAFVKRRAKNQFKNGGHPMLGRKQRPESIAKANASRAARRERKA